MNDDLNKDQKFVGMLTDIILANLENENFGVNDLARLSGMSHFVLSRKLHSAEGKTISQFIREIRLRKALEMLQAGDKTAAEVAYKTGFGSPTYFNTCFNEFFGYPPGRVKKNFTGNNKPLQSIDTEPLQKRRISGKQIITYTSSGVILFTALFILFKWIIPDYNTHINEKKDSRPDNSIAVLPFKNLSDSAGNQYFVDGINEDILTLLCQIGNLKVVSRTSVEQYRNTKLPLSKIAGQLNVKYILEGSVQKSGNMFRLWIQLIDATTGNHLWAEVYDGRYSTDIFDFQSSLARKVAGSLNVAISKKAEKKIDSHSTNEILAYDLTMKGQDFIRKWDLGGNGQYLKLAINNFEEALKIDPDYIAAFMGKAQALVKSGSYDSSKIYCKKVLAIDKENAYALGGLGAYYLYTVNPDSALFFLQKSNENLINDENQFWNYLAIGQIYLCQKNDLIYALQSFQKAYESGGDSWPEIHENIALIFSSSADYSKAFGYMLNALSMTSGCVYVQKSSSILLASQRYNEAKNFIDSIARITPCDQICDVMRFHMYTLQKEFDKADVFLNKAVNSGYILLKDDYFYKYCLDKGIGRGSVCLPEIRSIVSGEEKLFETGKYYWVGESALRIAAGYTILGDKRKALTYLKKLEELVFTDTAFPLNSFPGFDNLRNDPEFKAITERIESKRSSLRKMVRELQLQGEVRL